MTDDPKSPVEDDVLNPEKQFPHPEDLPSPVEGNDDSDDMYDMPDDPDVKQDGQTG